ncbi:MAG TPA: FAD-binding oxidoreductase [Intrasporangium sp.]|nr:FAD-binding oxidoreductase [Intrasporangium sp.]
MSWSQARLAAHSRAVEQVVREYAALPADEPVRLAKRTSNLFRPRAAHTGPGLDVSSLDHVVELDPQRGVARVQGMATYERLVDELLPHGFVPLVVPQLKTITIGGAVTGLGIEASSFRNGLPHESVLELEILTGSGRVVTARPQGEHADLFHVFPNSYGSLGYALSLTIELEHASRYVALRHVRFACLADLVAAVGTIMASRCWEDEPVDFLDGVVFGRHEAYLCLGRWTDSLEGQPRPSDYTGTEIFYHSIRERRRDVLTARDYLWRWDTDWFWCSRAFGAQQPLVRRLWPKRLLRSDTYWTIVGFENRHGVMATLDRWRGRPERERVVQDVEIPLSRTAEFLEWFLDEVPIEPIWLCPVRLRAASTVPGGGPPWPLYPMRPGEPYVNVGFWSSVPVAPGRQVGDVNRDLEAQVGRLGGHKSLYSDAFYDEDTFDALYGGAAYRPVKATYDPAGRLPTLYEKAVQAR